MILDAVPVFAVIVFLLGAASVLMLRPTVVVVTDDYFSAMYGVRREHLKRVEMSARMFRLVKFVRMAEGVETDAVVYAVRNAARNAKAAVFPYRYHDAAVRYADSAPKAVPVVLLGLNPVPPAPAPAADGEEGVRTGIVYVRQDEEADFYRAGRVAAILSARDGKGAPVPDTNMTVLAISRELNGADTEAVFQRGLRDGGSGAACVFRRSGDSYPQDELSCAVIWGPASGLLHDSLETVTPTVVFSWVDPAFTSANVKVVIDDSPLQLAPAVTAAIRGRTRSQVRRGEDADIAVPSTFKAMSLRSGHPLNAVRLNATALARMPRAAAAPEPEQPAE